MYDRSNQGERVTHWLLSSLLVSITSIAVLNCSSSSSSEPIGVRPRSQLLG